MTDDRDDDLRLNAVYGVILIGALVMGLVVGYGHGMRRANRCGDACPRVCGGVQENASMEARRR